MNEPWHCRLSLCRCYSEVTAFLVQRFYYETIAKHPDAVLVCPQCGHRITEKEEEQSKREP